MKLILFIIAFLLTMHVFAQNKLPESRPCHQGITPLENNNIIDVCKSKTVANEAIWNPDEVVNPSFHRQSNLFKVFDSIYEYIWYPDMTNWTLTNRTIDFNYDANKNELGHIIQKLNGNVWQNYNKVIKTFDTKNNWNNGIIQNWNGNAWENSSQVSLTFDANNNRTSYLTQNWDGGAWINQFLYIFTYDASNNLSNTVFQFWDTGAWQISSKSNYSYDANNNLTEYLAQNWDNNQWTDADKITYSYNSNNYKTGYIEQRFYGPIWLNYSQYTATFDTNNNLVGRLYQSWVGSQWENTEHYSSIFDGSNKLLVDLYQVWQNNQWTNSTIDSCSYDANNNRTGDMIHKWNGSKWINYYEIDNTYDANKFILSYSNKSWDENTGQISFGDSIHYYFQTTVGIKDLESVVQSLFISPNPGNGKFAISSTNPINSVEIYNLAGSCIYKVNNPGRQSSVKLDLSAFPKGIYIVKAYTGNKMQSGKIIIQ